MFLSIGLQQLIQQSPVPDVPFYGRNLQEFQDGLGRDAIVEDTIIVGYIIDNDHDGDSRGRRRGGQRGRYSSGGGRGGRGRRGRRGGRDERGNRGGLGGVSDGGVGGVSTGAANRSNTFRNILVLSEFLDYACNSNENHS